MTDNSLERNLIKELKDGSYLAFDKLFAKYGEHLFCFVFSILKSSDDSKEIVQDVFVKVWEKRQTLNEFLSFKSFLFSIAYHQIISGFRKKASEKKYLEELVSISSGLALSPDLEIDFEVLTARIDDIVNDMPPQRRGIFIMSRFEGLSHAEIASKLNISVKTVENHINLSLKTLRLKLGDYALAGLLVIELMSI